MELYVSPACTVEAVVDEGWPRWMQFNWLTLVATVFVSAGQVIASHQTV